MIDRFLRPNLSAHPVPLITIAVLLALWMFLALTLPVRRSADSHDDKVAALFSSPVSDLTALSPTQAAASGREFWSPTAAARAPMARSLNQQVTQQVATGKRASAVAPLRSGDDSFTCSGT